ncbi:MAG: fused MFS/spermidine synthase [Acidobacteriota bacterium]|nr:fused MFS/spermidine synthase [Acidobacteriota bacterium]
MAKQRSWLLLLFVGSGCAALIYEVVWFQLLQLVIGSSAVSLGVLLGTFMGGMCLGSLLLPRFVSRDVHPLKVYAVLEAAIGALAVLVLLITPLIGYIYSATVGHGFGSILLRGVVAAVCLLPPTLLMGATLPAIARWIEMTPRGVAWLGYFYGGNIAGAVFGCLLAGFYLLRVHDMTTSTLAGVAINLLVAGAAWMLAARTPALAASEGPAHDRGRDAPPQATRGTGTVYAAIAISGATALGSQVIWTRLLSLLVGATVYAFSIILAVFLVGLGIGSSLGAFAARASARPRLALGACQLMLMGAIAWAAYMLSAGLPYWPINPSLAMTPGIVFQVDLVRSAWVVLPGAILWGASFPLALAAVADTGQDPGRVVGRVYAANTAGAIAGALAASLFLVDSMGTLRAQQIFIALSAIAACLAMAPLLWTSPGSPKPTEQPLGTPGFTLVVIALVAAIFTVNRLPPVPGMLIAYGRYMVTWLGQADVVFAGEGLNSSVAVTQLSSGIRNFHVSGKVEASSEPQDMRLQRMLGHLPALLHPNPQSVLVVGCGAGVTAGSFVTYPSLQRLVIAEIEPLIPKVVTTYFGRENHNVVNDPRVEIVYDDARHYVLTTGEQFDIITSDPIHPWVKGSATLYTKEYFEMVKRHLKPGGIVTQWVPLYESDLDVVRSEIATFVSVFPDATIWANLQEGQGYDIVLLGQNTPGPIDLDALQRRFDDPRNAPAAESMREVAFLSPLDLLATYGGRGTDLQPWLEGAQINRDRNLRLQYLAGMQLNRYQGGAIFDSMARHRTFPDSLFTGAEGLKARLREQMGIFGR